MANFIDKMTVVEAETIYEGGELIGSDYKVALPDVVPETSDVSGLMGVMNMPMLNTIQSMEATITKQGVDANAARMSTPGKKDLQINWVEDKVSSSGDVSVIGCKAQLGCFPKSYMPAIELERGSMPEFDCTYEVFEYKLTVAGEVIFHVNRITGVLKMWDGKKLVDFSESFAELL